MNNNLVLSENKPLTDKQEEAILMLHILPAVEEFAARVKNKLAYCPRERLWMSYGGKCWAEDPGAEVFHAEFKAMTKEMMLDAVNMPDPKMKAEAIRAAIRLETKYATQFERYAKRELVVDRAQFDRLPHLINCQTGTINLKTGKIQDHRAEDYLMNCAPVKYREDAECPLYEQTLREITGEIRLPWQTQDKTDDEQRNARELQAAINRFFGLALTGEVRDHIVPLWQGEGRNGKSMLLNIAVRILGIKEEGGYTGRVDKGVLTRRKNDGLEAKREIENLRGVRLAIANEPDSTKDWDAEFIKDLSGERIQKGRGIGRDAVTFVASHKLIITMNNSPKLTETGKAMEGRLLLFPFNTSFLGHEKEGLEEALAAEAEGIFALWVREAVEYYRSGLLKPDVVRMATRKFLDKANTVQSFFAECVDITRNTTGDKILASVLFDRYREWCAGEFAEPAGLQQFAGVAKGLVPLVKKPSNKLTFYGIQLKPVEVEVEVEDQAGSNVLYGQFRPNIPPASMSGKPGASAYQPQADEMVI